MSDGGDRRFGFAIERPRQNGRRGDSAGHGANADVATGQKTVTVTDAEVSHPVDFQSSGRPGPVTQNDEHGTRATSDGGDS
jgi:hypothetical protein